MVSVDQEFGTSIIKHVWLRVCYVVVVTRWLWLGSSQRLHSSIWHLIWDNPNSSSSLAISLCSCVVYSRDLSSSSFRGELPRCVRVYLCIYTYIYTEKKRETERQTERQGAREVNMFSPFTTQLWKLAASLLQSCVHQDSHKVPPGSRRGNIDPTP